MEVDYQVYEPGAKVSAEWDGLLVVSVCVDC